MNHAQIAELLDRYWEGETTLVEERRLKEYFAGGNIDDRFREFVPLFQALKQAHHVKAPEHIGQSISPSPLRVVGYRGWKHYMAAAVFAGIAAAGIWGLYPTHPPQPVDNNTASWVATPPPVVAPQQPTATVAIVEAKMPVPKRKKNIAKPPEAFSQAEALKAAQEIKAALALVSRKLNKGKNDATKNLDKVEMVDQLFKQG